MAFLFTLTAVSFISVNGTIRNEGEPAILSSNRGYRYGEGLFETMKVQGGKVFFLDHHFDRLMTGLSILKFPVPEGFFPDKMEKDIVAICAANNCGQLARVRL